MWSDFQIRIPSNKEWRNRLDPLSPGNKSPQSILNFSKPNEISKIITGSDKEIGGFSTVHFDQCKETSDSDPTITDQFGSFQGYLNIDPPLGRSNVHQSGYAMFRTQSLPLSPIFHQPTFHNWSNLSHLLLAVRGDHRAYSVNFQTDSTSATDLYQHRLSLQTPGHWETVVIPLKDFVLTNNGVIQHQVDIDLTKVKTFGVGVNGRVLGPFRLDFKDVRCVSGEDTL
ncbi:hypothetical protein WICPIJ_001877 [Wickerhamomyces pijperi]|uniref:NADH:ubiquinone oxidoreductase intermediate-associated protein 30 domain-containing protein n=1 Tax=Wickerhamomyces pijperi TaxID=599730 RepID=A0A9P8QCQ6_WICPI|nr:hypothetical protein WICPIJ_001877 [Wickerhamomyces pijperi]